MFLLESMSNSLSILSEKLFFLCLYVCAAALFCSFLFSLRSSPLSEDALEHVDASEFDLGMN